MLAFAMIAKKGGKMDKPAIVLLLIYAVVAI